MPHHHFAARHAHGHAHAHVQRDDQDLWDKITSKAASVFNEAFPTPANPANKQAQVQQSTSYRTVYITQTPSSFQGQLTTLKPSATPPVVQPAKVTANTDTLELETADPTTPTPQPTTLSSKVVTKSAAPTTPKELSEITTVSPDSIPTTLAMAPTTSPTTTTRRAQATVHTPTPTPSAEAKSEGTSGAAKAGIAIGILAGVLVLFLAVYFLFTRRRKQVQEQQRLAAEIDEKRNGPFSDRHAIATAPTPTTPAKAPQLSLRPGSQFSPNLNAHPDRRASRGANMAMAGSRLQQMSTVNNDNTAANPFGDHAQRMHTPIAEEGPRSVSPVSIQNSEVGTAITTNSPPRTSPVGAAAAAGVAVGVARKTSVQRGNAPKALDLSRGPSNEGQQASNGNLARKASLRKDNAAPSPLDLTMPLPLGTIPASPAGTEFSFNSVAPGQSPGPSDSAAAIAAAGGPPQSTVHRVQLDFKPTMEDELELRAGQLVRLLHEYDDGWALCIRLDRSAQGVVPRTCLSTRPVKPRPPPNGQRPGPPVNPNRGPGPMNRPPQGGPGYPRPGSAQSQRNSPPQQYARPGSAQSGRQSPAGGYPMGPGRPRAGSSAQQGRPMSPANAQQRSQSPGPRYQQQQPRPQSPSGMQPRMSPPGQSPMNPQYANGPPTGPVGRKPVPGQAQ